jgi:chromosome segregation ATPase
MSEKLLKAILALVLIAVLWQIVAMRRDLATEKSDIASLNAQIDSLRRAAQADAWSGKTPPPTGTSAKASEARATLRRVEQESSARQPNAKDAGEPARALDEARWKDQQQAISQLGTQLQAILHDVETIGAAVEALGTAVVELRTGAQTIATDVTTVGREVARLNSALERLAGENR